MTSSAISELTIAHLSARPNDESGNRAAPSASSIRRRARADFAQYRTRPWTKLALLAFGFVVAGVLWTAWLNRQDSGLTPESGIGYWLGIAGSSLMVLLLLYPLRKRMPFLRALGSVAFWFRAHMILGVLGPLLIVLHSNFRLGSINSNMALAAMLIVAASGVAGRYLYSKIHLGLYGRKAEIKEILADADALTGIIGADRVVSDRIIAQLNGFADRGAAAPNGVITGLLSLPVIGWRAGAVRARLIADARQAITAESKRLGWSRRVRRQRLAVVADLVTLHVAVVRKAAALAFYERLFRLWHVFHLPLFFLLVVAAIIHIFAAHFF
ncbi:pyridine nucleotide-disulfide oxidoreductase [Bradyrhizobium sediminis]|uniref:Pyridine nucleotide-disulfide oxidoreductase n=1 Tax=Bradyrhizobium sediminis TaxID=2840469 RepID=A0A975RS28_9BRAD|nr:pyridine nucleotide-disulfide oxidoreductase [Bradyrhizobium sediminis]QWG17311.1 pyridine nucleotide-disulfide oxidoreductase [Bradyrhizobium sediminis]